ncbi:MAG: potassium channel family protein [Leptothrix sp. (in: b-proteobacteria)]
MPTHAISSHWWPTQALRWLVIVLLLLTIPAFYLEMQQAAPALLAPAVYAAAGLALAFGRQQLDIAPRKRQAVLTAVLVFGLALAAALPSSVESTPALTLRLLVALLTLTYLVWSLQHLLERGSLPALLAIALTVLLLCGVGFWWLEPRVNSLADGLWLAFTTAATVGFGDIVPSTPASKIFSVFVVLLGYGVLSLVTAGIAAMWVESSEQRLEHDILADLHRQMSALRKEIALLRTQLDGLPPLISEHAALAPLSRQDQQALENQRIDQLKRQA